MVGAKGMTIMDIFGLKRQLWALRVARWNDRGTDGRRLKHDYLPQVLGASGDMYNLQTVLDVFYFRLEQLKAHTGFTGVWNPVV